MKVIVVGAGAMGSIFGAALLDAGNDVKLVEVNSAVVESVRQSGVTIIDAKGASRVFPIDITDAPGTDGVSDVVMFFVKGFQTEAAAHLVAPCVGPNTTLVTLQNGIGNEDTLRSVFSANPIVIGNSVHSAYVDGSGVVHHTGVQPTFIGPDATTSDESVTKVARAFEGSGFVVEVLDRSAVVRQRWSKLVMNCSLLPIGALSGLDTKALGLFEPLSWLIDALVRESCEIARKAGVDLDIEERIEFTGGLLVTAGGRGSMTQDILLGRRTEIDTINGFVVRTARDYGLDATLNNVMMSLVKGREAANAHD